MAQGPIADSRPARPVALAGDTVCLETNTATYAAPVCQMSPCPLLSPATPIAARLTVCRPLTKQSLNTRPGVESAEYVRRLAPPLRPPSPDIVLPAWPLPRPKELLLRHTRKPRQVLMSSPFSQLPSLLAARPVRRRRPEK